MKKHIIKNLTIKNLTNKKIKIINKVYKKKKKKTDILTFTNENYYKLGELITTKKNKKILIHGALHLLKYNHKKKKDFQIMNKIEKMIGMSGIEPPTTTTSK